MTIARNPDIIRWLWDLLNPDEQYKLFCEACEALEELRDKQTTQESEEKVV